MKTLLTLIIAVLCSITTNATASTGSIGEDHNIWSIETFVGVANKHVQPNGVKMYNHAIGVAGLHVWHLPSGIYLEGLARGGFDQHHTHGDENEFDFGVGINRKIFRQCRIDLSLTYDHSIHMGSSVLDDFWRFGLVFGLDSKKFRKHLSISPFVGVQVFVTQREKSKHIEDGVIWTIAGVNLETEIGKAKIVYTPSIGWDDGFMKAKPGFVFTNSLKIDYALTKRWHLEAGLTGIISRQTVGLINAQIAWHW